MRTQFLGNVTFSHPRKLVTPIPILIAIYSQCHERWVVQVNSTHHTLIPSKIHRVMTLSFEPLPSTDFPCLLQVSPALISPPITQSPYIIINTALPPVCLAQEPICILTIPQPHGAVHSSQIIDRNVVLDNLFIQNLCSLPPVPRKGLI